MIGPGAPGSLHSNRPSPLIGINVFGRTEKNESAVEPTDQVAGKGRPTPSRKEAEAAARERARASVDKKAAQRLLRERRAEANRKMREGMKAGDEKYLPARDQGPVKRFIRDWVDSRLTFAEFLLPILILIMIGSGFGERGSTIEAVVGYVWTASLLLLLTDTVLMRFRLKRALKATFPDENLKGAMFYAYIRMLQIRFMRMPKPKVKLGGKPV